MKTLTEFILHMEKPHQQIYNRLSKIIESLGETQKDYAIVGGNAIIAWMRACDMDSRTTRDVDVMIRKEDLAMIRQTLEQKGYEYIKSGAMSLFFDKNEGVPRKVENCVHLFFSGEKIKNVTLPELKWDNVNGMKVATIENLVQMKVSAGRIKDIEHLQDLVNAGYTTVSKIQSMTEKLHLSEEKRVLLSYIKPKSRGRKL